MEVQLIEDQSVVLEEDGKRVRVRVESTEEGPLLTLEAVNCNLEGDMPGAYYLTELGES